MEEQNTKRRWYDGIVKTAKVIWNGDGTKDPRYGSHCYDTDNLKCRGCPLVINWGFRKKED